MVALYQPRHEPLLNLIQRAFTAWLGRSPALGAMVRRQIHMPLRPISWAIYHVQLDEVHICQLATHGTMQDCSSCTSAGPGVVERVMPFRWSFALTKRFEREVAGMRPRFIEEDYPLGRASLR
jgi:hypothetical protein